MKAKDKNSGSGVLHNAADGSPVATPAPAAASSSSPIGQAGKALAMLEIDRNGLDEMDKRILEAVIVKFGGGPVGVNSLAVAVGEEPDTIEEVYEPYLIMEGYLNRTSQGRVATELSYKKLGLKAATGNQSRLF